MGLFFLENYHYPFDLQGPIFRGEGLVGLFFLENYHYPFDLQVGPLLGTHGEWGGGESWPLLDKS